MEQRQYNCLICKKTFSSPQSKWNHKQRCKGPYDIAASSHSKWKNDDIPNGKRKSSTPFLERLNRNKQGSGGGGFMESLLRQDNKPEPKNGLELNEEDKKLINSLPEESNVEEKDENLGKRLKRLYFEDKVGNRNELLYILGKMLHLGYITLQEFQSVNNVLLDKDENDEEEEEEEDDKDGLIRSTTEFMIKRDKDKLKKLIEKFKTFVDSEDSSEELELEELGKLIDDEQLEFETIRNHVSRLENSDIPRLKLLKFEIILKNMVENQYRVRSVLQRLSDVQDEEKFAYIVQNLAREGLISEETRTQLLEKDAVLELKAIADIVKTKVGSGLYLKPYF